MGEYRSYTAFVIARAIHILGVVIWIGGVSFVTLVLIPAVSKKSEGKRRMEWFSVLEHGFSFYAKTMVILVGLSGLYMLYFLNGWSRYLHLQFWWLQLMTFVWLVFFVVLFVLEPFVLHKLFHRLIDEEPGAALTRVKWMHYILLTISLLAVFGGVGGAHGLF